MWIFRLFLLEVMLVRFSKIVVVAGSWSPKDGAQDGRFARQGICAFGAFRTRAELELPKRQRKYSKIVAAAGIASPPGRKRFGAPRGGRWIFHWFFLEVVFHEVSKIVVVAASWSANDGAEDGRFARQGICAFGAFRTRAELE